MMPTIHTSDGRTLTWTGHNLCYCTKCEQLFNSVAAFDAHIRRPKGPVGRGKKAAPISGPGIHDFSWMPRNNAGRLVTSLREANEPS
ncbi:MAG: hypothetical protein H3C62_14065 [Gemmatimonadaceae bacterium]|nr:hypothetical protein [Gemmatimonadaceae bacterium]